MPDKNMKKRTLCTLFSLLMLFALAGAACASAAESSAASVEARGAQRKYEYNVGASAISGQSYRWVVPMCEIVNKYSDFVTLNPITTTGSTENVNLIVNGEAEFGVGPASTVYNAINGLVDWEGAPVSGIEFVYFMFPDYFNIILPAKSTVETLTDLKGKTVSIGETGAGYYTNTLAAMNAMGYSLDDFKLENMNLTDTCTAITEGWVDALLMYGSPQISAVSEMQAGPAGLKMVALTDKEIATACAANPIFLPRTLTDTYEGIPPLQTFGGSTALFTRADVPAEVTYEIARIINENVAELARIFPLGRESTIKNSVGAVSIVPTAEGTLKYMREQGLMQN
jgi:TRAP transporter TAXI family solute receptor